MTPPLTVAQLIARLQHIDPEAIIRTESGEGLSDVLVSDQNTPFWNHELTVHLLFYADETTALIAADQASPVQL